MFNNILAQAIYIVKTFLINILSVLPNSDIELRWDYVYNNMIERKWGDCVRERAKDQCNAYS